MTAAEIGYDRAAQAMRILALAGAREIYFDDLGRRDEFFALFGRPPLHTGKGPSVDGVMLKVTPSPIHSATCTIIDDIGDEYRPPQGLRSMLRDAGSQLPKRQE